jgi:hypothetical protein
VLADHVPAVDLDGLAGLAAAGHREDHRVRELIGKTDLADR